MVDTMYRRGNNLVLSDYCWSSFMKSIDDKSYARDIYHNW